MKKYYERSRYEVYESQIFARQYACTQSTQCDRAFKGGKGYCPITFPVSRDLAPSDFLLFLKLKIAPIWKKIKSQNPLGATIYHY